MNLRKNRSASSPPDLKALPLSVSFCGWRFAHMHFKSWAEKMAALHEPTWREAGIFEAIMASTTKIPKNTDLVLGIAEKWCTHTKTFVFSWGETTITLEDVMVLLGFSVLGLPVFATLDSSEKKKILRNLEKEWLKIKKDKVIFVTQRLWMSRFMDSGDELEHVAFLALWLSYFVFPSCYYNISEAIFPIAVHLSRGSRIALAPAVLAHLYAELTLLKNHIRAFTETTDKIDLTSLFKLVQVWTWERFKNLRPEAKDIPKGEARISRWEDLKQKTENVRLNLDDFEWRPYTKPLNNWNPLGFYVEEAMWITVDNSVDDKFVSFARSVRSSQLVGVCYVEDYYPNRVAMQFGLAQDIPSLVTDHSNFTGREAWDDYNKSLDGLKLYMPSRLAHGSVTTRYQDWWLKSVSEEMQRESAETLNARNSLDDESCMDEDDDNMTIAQRIRFLKRHSDAEKSGGYASKSLGKRSSKFQVVDSDDETASKAQKTMQNCDDVIGNTAEKKTTGRDGTKKAECLLREAGEKQRCNEDDDIDERLRKRKIAIQEIALKLEERIIKEEESLAEIRKWITRRSQIQTGVSA